MTGSCEGISAHHNLLKDCHLIYDMPYRIIDGKKVRIGMQKGFKHRKEFGEAVGNRLRGVPRTEEVKRKMREHRKYDTITEELRIKLRAGCKRVYERILQEIPELEKQGFKCIPIGKVVPDIIAFRDGKIYAMEVEYGRPNYDKYSKDNYRELFEDVIWLLRKKHEGKN